jgi:hypothetical protein
VDLLRTFQAYPRRPEQGNVFGVYAEWGGFGGSVPADRIPIFMHLNMVKFLVDERNAADHPRRRCLLLRDVFGNPFRPNPPLAASVLSWNDGTVRRIAEGVYQERAFDRLPVLADALQDAGCDHDDLIRHCRSAGPHVRGCWAIDLILGKA